MKDKAKDCVFFGCKNKAVGECSVCGIPVCEVHSRKATNGRIVCLNCHKFRRR